MNSSQLKVVSSGLVIAKVREANRTLCRHHNHSWSVLFTCGMLKLLVVYNIRNALLSFLFWHFHLHILLASLVLCIALSHIETWCILRQYIQLRGRTSSCSPTHRPIIFLKTATIPTYHDISISVPKYIFIAISILLDH